MYFDKHLANCNTNASESMNALLKKVNYKKNELSLFIAELKAVIEEQERELEHAVIDKGKYQFCRVSA